MNALSLLQRVLVAFSALVFGLSLWAYLLPDSNANHSGWYAVILSFLMVCLLRSIWMMLRKSAELSLSKKFYLTTLAGAVFCGIFALANGLLDPDVATASGSPGAITAIPGSTAQVRFGSIDLQTGTASPLTIITPSSDGELLFSGAHRLLNTAFLSVRHETASALRAQSLNGETLTITRPQGGGFLAPLLLFRSNTTIANVALPTDSVALPAQNLHVIAFLIDDKTSQSGHFARVANGKPGILFDVEDGLGHTVPGGIAFAANGSPLQIAGVILTPHLLQYPTLLLTSVPSPIALSFGALAFLIGLIGLFMANRSSHQVLSVPVPSVP